jgi:imidazolonepropionase
MQMNHSNLLIKNIGRLLIASHHPLSFKKGKALSTLDAVDTAFLIIQNEKIESFGSMSELPSFDGKVIDANGGYVMPTFIDCHTHLVFADWRESEFVNRLQGLSYQEISERGGGILNSAKKLAALSEDELYERSSQRLKDAIRSGTGGIEIKSGYGLNTENELKMLRVIKRLRNDFPIPVKATFLGAHSFPLQFKSDHQGYITQIIDEMLPEIAKEGLADFCDVFCEANFYSPAETEQIIQAAAKYNIPSRIHTNQFTHSGGIATAIKNQAISVEHLEVCNSEEIELLKDSQTHPVLLPSAAFFMDQEYPPARMMIDRGLGVVLASDFNPGTSPSCNMAFVMSLACIKMKMTPEEALNAMTLNAAHSLNIHSDYGSIESGKTANLILTKNVPSLAYLPYSFGSSWIDKVFIRGNPEFLL